MFNQEREEEKKYKVKIEAIIGKRKESLDAGKQLTIVRRKLDRLNNRFLKSRSNNRNIWSELFRLLDDAFRFIDIILIRNTSIVREDDIKKLERAKGKRGEKR